MRKPKYDKFGFEIVDYDEPMDFTSTDDDDGDTVETESVWWRDSDYAEEELAEE